MQSKLHISLEPTRVQIPATQKIYFLSSYALWEIEKEQIRKYDVSLLEWVQKNRRKQ